MLGVTEIQDKVVDSVRHVWLAGIGAAIMAQEEGSKIVHESSKVFDTLVQKGEKAEKEAKDKATSKWDTMSERFDQQVAASLHRIGVPTREEIATLTRRVDALIASVDKLRAKSQGEH